MAKATANIGLLYAIRFFFGLIPAYVIERLYWEERGMTIAMVVYTEMIFAVTIVLAEIPTGIIADRQGRKPMIVWTAALGCAEFLMLIYADAFWHFAVVVAVAAVGASAFSGAGNALLYDSLRTAGREREFEKYVGRMNGVDIVSTIVAALCGSWLASRYGFSLNYWISLGSAAVSLGLTFALIEPRRGGGEQEEPPLPVRRYVIDSLRFFRRNPGVSIAVLTGMVAGAALDYVDEFWQIYLHRTEIPVVAFGMFSAAMFVLRLPGNLFLYRLRKRFSTRVLLISATCAFSLLYLVMAAAQGIYGVLAILAICLFAGIMEPLVSGYLHHRIDSSMRATVESFQSLASNGMLLLTGWGFGYVSSVLDIFGGFGFIAALCAGYLVILGFAAKRISDGGS